MDFTGNTLIGLITALSGIVIALITSYVSRRKDGEVVLTTREQQVSAEVWKIIQELKQSIKEEQDQNKDFRERIEELETSLRELRVRELTLMGDNLRLTQRVAELEKQLQGKG
jgi:septal ring factor EnvC (AmiA/AmiB activator)